MLAFIFPGQGSQKPGMGAPWVNHPSWELVEDASRAVDRDVARLLLEAGADELTQTRNSQFATFVLSLVILDAIERLGITPAFVAGHSLGEYTGLVATGALSFEDAARIVFERGEGMQQAAEDQPGTMYAVLGLEDDQVDVACRRADGDAWTANYNAPGQVIISGSSEALDRAAGIAKELGAKRAVPIPVGGAFHTPYMASAKNRLRKALEHATFRDPEIPIVANVDSLVHASGAEWIDLCSAQLCSPVRWRHSVEELIKLGATTFVEVGPGNVLTGLMKRIDADVSAFTISSPDELDSLVAQLTRAAAAADEPIEQLEGEHLFVHERLVVSGHAGLFDFVKPPDGPAIGDLLKVGAVVGRVGDELVRTPFAGRLMGTMTIPGERVSKGQPIAWLRSEQ